MKYLVFLAILFSVYSCQDEIPEYAKVLTVDIKNGRVGFQKVKLKGIKSLDEFESERFKYLTNAKISLFLELGTEIDETTATIKEINDVTYRDKGVAPSIRYTIEDDTLIPYTLEDLILLTLHYNLRESIDFFESLGVNLNKGVDNKPYGQIRVFYKLNFEIPNQKQERDQIRDNAMYYPLLNSLAFFEQEKYKHLALVANPMVVTHEFAHSIFAYLADGILDENDVFYDYLPKNCFDVHDDFYKSAMNEGFSDYWATVKTGSSDLFYLSVTKKETGAAYFIIYDRSLNNNRVLTYDMLVDNLDPNTCQNEAQAEKSYYWAGTIWASSLWEIYSNLDIRDFNKLVLKSYLCLHDNFNRYNNRITMALGPNCLVKTLKENQVESSKIREVCSVFKRRFSIIIEDLYECE